MRIILLGLPGSGKEELAKNLAAHYEVPLLTLAGMLNEIAAETSSLGRLVKEAALIGKFSDELIMAALRIRLAKPDAINGFIMEDFPRTIGQTKTLEILMRGLRNPVNGVIKVEISSDDLMERLVGRITCQNCGEKYNIYSNPPIVEGMCNVCGERIRSRPDDYEENISNRIRNCDMMMIPLIEFYKSKECFYTVPGNTTNKKILKSSLKLIETWPEVEIPEEDDVPVLPMDESLLKALMAPAHDGEPRRRGRPRRIKDPEEIAAEEEAVAKKAKAKAAKKEQKEQKIAAAKEEKAKNKKLAAQEKEAKAKAVAEKKAAAKKQSAEKKAAKTSTKKSSVAKKGSSKKVASKKVASKKAVTKKAATKKAVTKKAVTKKAVTKKAVTKKTATKKAAVKKKVVKKAVAKKKVVKKAATKKKVVKKVVAKKAVAKKKPPVKKVATKKKVVKKTVSKKKAAKKKASRRR